ncbi:GPI inositol-deacylase [Lachancea thermotolerans]
MVTEKASIESSSEDSDLRRDIEAVSLVSEDGSERDSSEISNAETDVGPFIGGSKVANSSRPKPDKLHSIYDDDSESEDSNDETPPEHMDESRVNKQSHTIFTFNLPFGGKSLLPTSPFTSLKNTFMPTSSEDKNKTKSRRKIKLKLKRQETISSVEEIELFKDQKGIDNVRARAVKRALKPESLFHTIRSFSLDQQAQTHDGYECERLESIWNELDGNIVILGGYRGSILRDAETKKRVWIPIRAGLNIRKVDLLIGPKDEDEIEAQHKLYADGMLTHLGPVDVCKKLIKKLRNNTNVSIEEFGYDWRLSLEIPAKQLAKKLQEIYDKQVEKKGTYLIAHSMGGLVAHKVLQDHTHLIRGIIYVGSPSQCANILGPLRFGDEVIFNKSILSAEATFFMRSSFYFLPFDGRCFANKETLERYDLDFFDPDVWKKYGLSPLVDEERTKSEDEIKIPSPDKDRFSLIPHVDMMRSLSSGNDTVSFQTPYNECEEYLVRTLKRTKKYLASLDYDETKNYPPLAIVYGNRVPTVRGAKVSDRDQIKRGEYDEFYYGPGDGVVHHKWLLPEKRGFPVVAKVASECAHVSLMTDFEAMAKAFISLVDNEKC